MRYTWIAKAVTKVLYLTYSSSVQANFTTKVQIQKPQCENRMEVKKLHKYQVAKHC